VIFLSPLLNSVNQKDTGKDRTMPPTPIVPDLYALDLGGVNAYLIAADDGLTLIDTGPAGSLSRLARELGALGHTPADIARIIVTHAHPDHAGGLAELQAHTGAPTWMHPLDAAPVRNGTAIRPSLGPTPGFVNQIIYRLTVARAPRHITPALVDHEFEDGAMLPFAGGLQVIHTPGHSAGQIALLWPAHGGVLFVADAAINEAGLALFPAYEDLAQGRESLARLSTHAFAVACFGHGRPITQNAAQRFRAKWGRTNRQSQTIQRSS
jgi:glyoxylase-like metal-dependent hydrolase (beta-lactamase superfamily II)